MNVDWDDNKADSNLSKHGIGFDDAVTVFDDPLARTRDDPDHSVDERRFVTIGRTQSDNLIVVCHTMTDEEIRIISAREAEPVERRDYEEEE
ncbi:MAG: BrnT family toxin [Pyrinomonadaceae bacterium MAG19_C2-C3]|nr:BrnT family toxin [Pyrinomonadaceae bacterium MAG19_C2-C3]